LWNTERNNPGKISLFNPDADGFPQDDYPTAYDYTFTDGTVVGSDKEFNDHLRDKSLELGKKIAFRIVELNGKPLYNIPEFEGEIVEIYCGTFKESIVKTNIYIINLGKVLF
jgi:hypothetical protein